MKTKLAILMAFFAALALPAGAMAAYNTGDSASTAGESQAITLEIDPAIEILSIAADSDTVAPVAGGDGAGDDAAYQADIDLRSNLSWTSTAVEGTSFGLETATLTITGNNASGGSNNAEGDGDGVQEYAVNYAIDVSWADDAGNYSGSVDHDVSNTL